MKELIHEQIGDLPEKDCKYFLADGTWSLFELIEYICDHLPPSQLLITSFSISEASIRALNELKLSGKITSLDGIFDPSLRKTKTALLYFASEVFDSMRFTANHSKVVLFSNDSKPMTLMASANLGRNRRIEAGVIDPRRSVLDFFYTQLTEIHQNSPPL